MLSLGELLKSAYVKRWNPFRTSRQQSLAEHQYVLTMIARNIAGRVMRGALTANDELALIDFTLRHDTPVLVLGDRPSYVKTLLSEICVNQRNPLEVLEERVCSHFSVAKARIVDTPLFLITKLADAAEQICFIRDEGMSRTGQALEESVMREFTGCLAAAQEHFPTLAWVEAQHVLDELLLDSTELLQLHY